MGAGGGCGDALAWRSFLGVPGGEDLLGGGCLVVGGGSAVVAQGVADAGVDGFHGVGGTFRGGVAGEVGE